MKIKGKVLGRVTELKLTQEQYEKLQRSTTGQGGHQSLCQRVYESVVKKNGDLVALVYDVDMERIRVEVQRPDRGTWQDNFRAIMGANNL